MPEISASNLERLRALAENAPRAPLRRRAVIILRTLEGQSTRQAAAEVSLSRGQVRYWKRRWREEEMGIFPGEDAGDAAPKVTAPPESESRPPEISAAPPPAEVPAAEESASPARVAAPPRSPVEALLREAPLPSPGLLPDDPMSEAGRKILRYHFIRMLQNEAGTRRGEDIEALHDMRVATRRMRAAFEVFAPYYRRKAVRPFLRGLRATGKALGRVRDLDVFMAKAQKYLKTLPKAERGGLSPLLDAWQAEREAARARMTTYLDSDKYRRFVETFARFLETPGAGARPQEGALPQPFRVCEVAPVLIYDRLAHVLAYEPVLAQAYIAQLHALRIAFKRLRYTVEFFREVLGEEAGEVIARIKAMQDHLGDLNDADVACEIISRFLAAWDENQRALPLSERDNPQPIVAYLAYRHAERHRLMTTFPAAWEQFHSPEFKRLLALAVAGGGW